jgi:F-type H+-transporting ATPase subunit b
VHSAVVHLHGSLVHLVAAATEPASKDPGPIVPELKELYWSIGAFVVFALAMRFYLFPKLKKGMDARYEGIRSSHESADAARAAARAEVADYQAQVAAIKAEANREIEAARTTVETERQAKLAEVNATLSAQRNAATAEAQAERAAAEQQVHTAVADVAGLAGELATGRRPSADVVARVVSEVMAR